MSYDLNETYIDERKANITAKQAEIDNLQQILQIFQVESKENIRAIQAEINQEIQQKQKDIQQANNEILQHCQEVIFV